MERGSYLTWLFHFSEVPYGEDETCSILTAVRGGIYSGGGEPDFLLLVFTCAAAG